MPDRHCETKVFTGEWGLTIQFSTERAGLVFYVLEKCNTDYWGTGKENFLSEWNKIEYREPLLFDQLSNTFLQISRQRRVRIRNLVFLSQTHVRFKIHF